MAVSSIARIRIVITGVPGTPAYLNYFFEATTLDAGNYQTAVLDMIDAGKAALRSGTTWTAVNPIPIIDVATGEVTDVAIGDGGAVAGTDSSDALPPANALLMRMHTSVFVGGREVRGRSFVPYFTEASNSAGSPSGATVSGWNGLFQDMNGTGGANGAMVVWSRAHARAEYVSSFDAWSQWGSVRSRRD